MTGSATRRHLRQGDAARDDKRWDDASRAYENALDANPGLAHIWVQLGHARKELGRMQGAEAAYRRALAKAPDVADTHLQLGHLLKITNRTDEAAQSYAMALKIDPATEDAAKELAGLGYSAEGNRIFSLHVTGRSLTQQRDGRVVVESQAVPSSADAHEALQWMTQERLQVTYDFYLSSSATTVASSGFAAVAIFDQIKLSLQVTLPPELFSMGQPGLLHLCLQPGGTVKTHSSRKSLAWIAVGLEETDLVFLYKSLKREKERRTVRLTDGH